MGFAVVLQPPQLAAWVMSVSQPFVGLPSQSAKPVVHDATAQLLERHAAVACARLHALAQAPQLFASVVVLTQVPLHSVGMLEEQPETHSYVVPESEQRGVPPEQAVGFAVVLQPPQLAAWVMSVSQPFVGLPSQSA